MKKHFLLFALMLAHLAFSQEERSSDVEKSINSSVKDHQKENPEFNKGVKTNQNLKYQQPYPLKSIYSQENGGSYSHFTSTAADDFDVPENTFWEISDLSAVSSFYADETFSFRIIFYTNSSQNLPGNIIHNEIINLPEPTKNPNLTLAKPLNLGSGKYWFSIQAIYASSGYWDWGSYFELPYGLASVWKNPSGNHYNRCTNWTIATDCTNTVAYNHIFNLNGTSYNTCKTFTGFIAPSDPVHAQRITRNEIPSVCGTTKIYPGNISAGNFHYKTYSIQNTSASEQCVIVSLRNQDVNQVFLAAYLNNFNSNDLSQNYLGDIGSSPYSGSSKIMSIVVPPNATVILVASETTANTTFTTMYDIKIASVDCAVVLRADETNKSSAFNIYPNPTNATLFVNGIIPQKVKVYDASGKIIQVKNNKNEINVENLIKGNYLIQYEDKNGKVYIEKFIKN